MPHRVHKHLTSNLVLDPLLRSIQRRGTARHVFTYANEVTKVTRELRTTQVVFKYLDYFFLIIISKRLPFIMMEENDVASRELKKLGRQIGFSYPSSPPEVVVFGNRKKLDYLAYEDKPGFALPDMVEIMKGCKDLSERDSVQIQKNWQINLQSMGEYRAGMADHVVKLYDIAGRNFNSVDDKLALYTELYGHCDGSMRELVKGRLLSLFSPAVRDALQDRERERERDRDHDRSRSVL